MNIQTITKPKPPVVKPIHFNDDDDEIVIDPNDDEPTYHYTKRIFNNKNEPGTFNWWLENENEKVEHFEDNFVSGLLESAKEIHHDIPMKRWG